MIAEQLVIEERLVKDFHRVKLTGHGEVYIEQGDTERLTIESHPDTVAMILSEVVLGRLELGQGRSWKDNLNFAMETSLVRNPIRYRLTVKKLNELVIRGVFEIRAQGISSDHLLLKANGPNHIKFESLAAEVFEVDLPVGGVLDLDGFATEQQVVIRGPANYRASTLKTKRANIKITGPSTAIVNVSEVLDVNIRGLGAVRYIGSPKLRKKISGLGDISKLNRKIATAKDVFRG